MRASTRDFAVTAGASTGAAAGGSIGGPAGAYAGGVVGGYVGGYAAGAAYDAASGIFGGGGKNAIELDERAYSLAPLRDWIDEAVWRGAPNDEITAAIAEGDRVTATLAAGSDLIPAIDPDMTWPGLPNATVRQLERAYAVQRLVSRYPERGPRPASRVPLIGRAARPEDAGTSGGTIASSVDRYVARTALGAIMGIGVGAAAGWIGTRAPRRKKHRVAAMAAAAIAGAVAGGGVARWTA